MMTKLRVVSGDLKGRYVTIAEDAGFRPTQERVRESAAEIVKRKILGASAADLCAGSGAFGFEMVSRGAAAVDFVEIDGRTADKIVDNAVNLGVKDRVRVIRDDVRRFADTAVSRYDMIFYDPPYDAAELRELIPKLLGLLRENGLLIYERRRCHSEKKSADISGKMNIVDARVYSDTVIEIYKRDDNADSALPGDV
jgi:16S rRNA (guanine966-N2)-methyltransferase